MKKIFTCVCLIFLMGACSKVDIPVKENMLKNKSFVFLYYPTLKECLDSQADPDFFENCHQQVDFFRNQRVEIMLSDIYYRGNYKIMGNQIVLTFPVSHEIPDGIIIFEMLHPTRLLKLDNGTIWKKLSGNSIYN